MKTVALGDLTASTRPICYGVLKPGNRVPNGVPLIRVTDITENRFDASDLYTISHALDDEFRRSRLKGGELLLSIQGTIGRVAICPAEYAGANISRTIAVIAPDERADRAYLYHYLRHLGASGGFHTVGTTRESLNIAAIRRLEVPLPPLPEQKRIAAILDAADALRAKRWESIEQLDSLVQATFLEMFGDPVTNPKGWQRLPLASVGAVTTGKTPPGSKSGMFGGEIPFATPGDLDDGLSATERTLTRDGSTYCRLVRAGATLVGCIGSIGKMARTPHPTAFNQQINAVEWDVAQMNDWFGLYALRREVHQMLRKASSTTVPILNKGAFETVVVVVPPLDLQTRFASIVESIEQQKARLKAHLTELDTLFASLQSRAFNGELVA